MSKSESSLSRHHGFRIIFLAGMFFGIFISLMSVAIIYHCDFIGKRKGDYDLSSLSISPPDVLWLRHIKIRPSHLSVILEARKADNRFPNCVTLQVLKGTDMDAVVPIVALLREKDVKEIRIVFSPFTAEELFPDEDKEIILVSQINFADAP